MGLTESNSKQLDAEQRYKLIRRYTSDCYGDLTVVQNKQNLKSYALKQLITEDDLIVKLIENRRKFKHKNLIYMEDYWFSGEQSICSNIKKVQMVFQYYPLTLDEQMKRKNQKGQYFSDAQILQILSDAIECLKYLEQKNFLHLVGSMKMILYDGQTKTIKIMENQEILMHSHRNKKKQMNVIGLLGSKRMLPLHPLNQPKDVCDVCLDSQKVSYQNLFTLGLISIGLCWMRQPLELGIFGKGGYNFEKIDKRIYQIKNKFPYLHKILSLFMLQRKKQQKVNYDVILSQIYSQRRSFSKQNDRNIKQIQIQPVEKVGDKRAKKLSYLRQMRLSNNDIPNQY